MKTVDIPKPLTLAYLRERLRTRNMTNVPHVLLYAPELDALLAALDVVEAVNIYATRGTEEGIELHRRLDAFHALLTGG